MSGILVIAAAFTAFFTNDFRQVALANVSHAPDAAKVECRWTVYRDGAHYANGTFGLTRFRTGPIKPGETAIAPIPHVLKGLSRKSGDLSLRVRFMDVSRPVAHLIDVVQLELPRRVPAAPLDPVRDPVEVTTNGSLLVVSGNGVSWGFNRRDGSIVSAKTGRWSKQEWFAEPPSFVGLGAYRGSSEFTFERETNSVSSLRLVRFDFADVALRWTARGDGALVCHGEIRRHANADLTARVAWHWRFASEDPLFEYTGDGVADPTGKDPMAGFFARYEAERLSDLKGVRKNVRALSFDAGWDHLSVVTAGEPFAFLPVDAASSPKRKGTTTIEIVPAWNALERTIPFAFVFRPEKAYAAVSIPREALPSPSRRFHFAIDPDDDGPRAKFFDLGRAMRVKGLRVAGDEMDFEIESSPDGRLFTREVADKLTPNRPWTEWIFKEPVKLRYLRFAATGNIRTSKPAAEADIEVIE